MMGGSFFNIDTLSRGSGIPVVDEMKSWSGSAWRGERISCQLLIWVTETSAEMNISATVVAGGKQLLYQLSK